MKDNLTKRQRSYCMSRVRSRDTDLERLVRSKLFRRGFRFRKHVANLPGRPDVVFPNARLAVFIDGDFWHGYRFPAWRNNVSKFWRTKIDRNRDRDRRNFARLRRMGWRVLRIWQHEIKDNVDSCIDRVESVHSAATAAARRRTTTRVSKKNKRVKVQQTTSGKPKRGKEEYGASAKNETEYQLGGSQGP